MLKQAVLQPSLLFFPRHPSLLGTGTSSVVAYSQQRQWRRQRRQNNRNNNNKVRCAAAANEFSLSGQPTIVAESRRQATVKAEATVLLTVGEVFAQMETTPELHDINGLLGQTLHLELVSADLSSLCNRSPSPLHLPITHEQPPSPSPRLPTTHSLSLLKGEEGTEVEVMRSSLVASKSKHQRERQRCGGSVPEALRWRKEEEHRGGFGLWL